MLLNACGRGDVAAAQTLTSPDLIGALSAEELMLLPDAAANEGRPQTVEACLAAGFPVGARDHGSATALHHAAINGRIAMVHALIAAGADLSAVDSETASPPLGWATFGADWVRDPAGDYESTVRALLEAGARLGPDDHQPEHEGVRRVLETYQKT